MSYRILPDVYFYLGDRKDQISVELVLELAHVWGFPLLPKISKVVLVMIRLKIFSVIGKPGLSRTSRVDSAILSLNLIHLFNIS
jgi:hypothetical protein